MKSFIEFINESLENNSFFKKTTKTIINSIKDSSLKDDYFLIKKIEIFEPFLCDICVYIKHSKIDNIQTDSHFKDMDWEIHNFEKFGYCIDANVKVNNNDYYVPEIKINILLSSVDEINYFELSNRLVDLLFHETTHLNQVGPDESPFNTHVSTNHERLKSKDSFKYFLLDEEVEAMVRGMYMRSKNTDTSIDIIFHQYLNPFIKQKFITQEEYNIVLKKWIIHSLETYPDAKYTDRVKKIVNSI
jgi:hypothetical protein